LLALLGVLAAAVAVFYDNQPAPSPAPVVPGLDMPYSAAIAGSGIVEPETGDIVVGTPVTGVVSAIYVQVGDSVKQGNPLFKIDDRDLQARMVTAEARVTVAAAALGSPTHKLEYAEHLSRRDPAAVSDQSLADLRDARTEAQATLELAKAQLTELRMQVEYHTVRAPVDGRILQLRMRVGELFEASGTSPTMMILGGDRRLRLRVDVDEHDALRFRPGADALAFFPGHAAPRIPLHYEYTEPDMVPKTSLTGLSAERVDTRVLQVLYSFEPGSLPVHFGQQLDVLIRAAPDGG